MTDNLGIAAAEERLWRFDEICSEFKLRDWFDSAPGESSSSCCEAGSDLTENCELAVCQCILCERWRRFGNGGSEQPRTIATMTTTTSQKKNRIYEVLTYEFVLGLSQK